MNEILASETEVRAATHSQDLGWVPPCPAPALLSSHFPHPCQEGHPQPPPPSFQEHWAHPAGETVGMQEMSEPPGHQAPAPLVEVALMTPIQRSPETPEPLREMHVGAGADGLGLHSNPDLVPPKLSDPGQVTAPVRGALTPPASEGGCEIRGNALKALDSQQALTKGGSSPTFPSCSVQGLWLLQGGP